MNYEESVNYIHERNKFGIKLGLESTARLLDKIGNPQKKLKFIHVAGTNGKGSTSSYIADILRESGFRTGKYISPYVYSFTERIQINGQNISEPDLAKYTTAVRDAIEKYSLTPTEFEVVTAVGMLYFCEKKCDYVVLEVGMGGRFDATNVIDPPSAAVITSISIDHTEYLGSSLSEIAFEKCGIIKNGSRVVAYPDNPPEAAEVIEKTAAERSVPLTVPNKSSIEIKSESINGTVFSYLGDEYRIKMLGRHQVYNAVTAIETAKLLGTDTKTIKRGIFTTSFPGRLEVISENPYIIQDGAHNLSGVAQLKNALKTYFSDKNIIIVMAMLRDKEYEKCIDCISECADIFIATEADNLRKAAAETIAQAARKRIGSVYARPDANDAVLLAKRLCGKNDVICICGSLYLLGTIDINNLK